MEWFLRALRPAFAVFLAAAVPAPAGWAAVGRVVLPARLSLRGPSASLRARETFLDELNLYLGA